VQGLRNCRKLLRHKSNRKVIESQYREMKNLYTLYYLHRLNTVVNLGMLGKISSYPTYPIAVILKMAMHLEDPERTALPWWRSRRLGTVGTAPSASSPGGPSSRTCSFAWAAPPGSVGRHLLGLPRSRSRPRSESGRLFLSDEGTLPSRTIHPA